MAAIDDIMQKVLDAVPFQLSLDDGIEAARKRFRELPRRPLHPEVDAQDYSIDGPGGPVGLRIYTPPNAAPGHPVVVFLHGGGFVLGDLDSYDAAAREHAVGADVGFQAAVGQHVIDVGDQFAGGKAGLVSVEHMLVEHDRHQLH